MRSQEEQFISTKLNLPKEITLLDFVIDNISLSMFKIENDLNIYTSKNSIISYMIECEDSPQLKEKVVSFLDNVEYEDILTTEEVQAIISLYYFDLNEVFRDIFDIFDFEEGFDSTWVGMTLKDPLYKFPELNFAKEMQVKFKLTANEVLKPIEDSFYDYATYAVGSWNGDLRDETMDYLNEYLKPALLSDQKAIDIDKEIKILEDLYTTIENIEEERSLYSKMRACSTLTKGEKRKLSSLERVSAIAFSSLPSTYNTKDKIEEKIYLLRGGK